MTTCECTSQCGDDPKVQARAALGCAKYRARRNPDALAATCQRLRAQLLAVVTLLDRMEPDVPEDQRASDEEWLETKAAAQVVLNETE